MEHQFWQKRWANMEIGFHESQANALLVRHFDVLGLKTASRILLPLCGKTLDIGWLLAQGYQVIGVELVEQAVAQLFDELGLRPTILIEGEHKRYSAKHIDILVGDFFTLSQEQVGQVDGVYDRAALVALPQEMRQRYSAHLQQVSHIAPQLLIVFEYHQASLSGPPFSISEQEVTRHYADNYQLKKLQSCALQGGLKGVCPAQEVVWHLHADELMKR